MNVEEKKAVDETTAPTALATDAKGDASTEAELIALILRQQELIVQQTEHLIRAMQAMMADHRPVPAPRLSLRAEVDELISALASITADDMARYAGFARSMFDTLKGFGAVGGGAVRGQS